MLAYLEKNIINIAASKFGNPINAIFIAHFTLTLRSSLVSIAWLALSLSPLVNEPVKIADNRIKITPTIPESLTVINKLLATREHTMEIIKIEKPTIKERFIISPLPW
jgi:hypothetical protein